MKKTILWSTAILSCLTLSGCSTFQEKQSDEQPKVEKSESKKKDYLSEAKKNIEEKALYQAKDNLEKAKSESEHKEEAEAGIEQIENYQKAESALSDEKYEESKKYLEKVESSKEGLAEMKDYASNLESEVSEKEKESKEEDEKSSSEEKEKHSEKEGTKESKVGSRNSSLSSSSVSGKNLSTSDKEAINDAMVSWCEKQAAKGGMAISENGFITPRGYNEESVYAVKTSDGEANIELGTDDAGHGINVIGYTTFYVPGSEGKSNDRGIHEGVAPGTIVDRYIWCDNGKVYELKAKCDSGDSSNVLQGWYPLIMDGEALARGEDTTFKSSEDKAAISEYQSLLEEYGQSANTKEVSSKKQEEVSHPTTRTNWNNDKESQLANFMDEWSSEMGQSYEPGEIDIEHNYVKMGFQTWCKEDEYQEACGLAIPKMNGEPINYTCDDEGEAGQYQVVACYGPRTDTVAEEDPDNRHYYVFTIKDGKPIVLSADDSENIKPTANTQLQEGFESIVNK